MPVHTRIISKRDYQNATRSNFSTPPPNDEVNYPPLTRGTGSITTKIDEPKFTPTHTLSKIIKNGVDRRSIYTLPTEIREMIWTSYLKEESRVECVEIGNYLGADPERPFFLPRACFMNDKPMNDIACSFIRNTPFLISTSTEDDFFRKFIDSVDHGAASVRELRFDYRTADVFVTRPRTDLAVHCPALRTLHINFLCPIWSVGPNPGPEPEEVQWLTADEIVEQYGLRKLINCKNLRQIKWALSPRFDTAKEQTLLSEVAAWAHNAFAKDNHAYKIESIVELDGVDRPSW